MRTVTIAIATLAVCSLATGATSGAPSSIQELFDDPEAAAKFDYCDWRFAAAGTADALPDFQTVLDNADGSSDESAQRAAALADAGTKIALAAADDRACKKIFTAGNKAHQKAFGKALRQRGSKLRLSPDPEIADVQTKLHDLWNQDQAARQVYVASRTDDNSGSRFWARRLAYSAATDVDARSTAYLRELVEKYDWIDARRFGKKIANHAWLLVQHADDHVEFQRLVLTRMEKYLADDGVAKRDYAYLWDRVAVNEDRLQRYGTQPDWECKDGKLELKPMEDPENVDARRAEMGMGPAEVDLARMSLSVCGKP